jgi:hypothetical protein
VGLELRQCAVERGHEHRGALPPLRHDKWSGRDVKMCLLPFTPLLLCHGRSHPAPASEVRSEGPNAKVAYSPEDAFIVLRRVTAFPHPGALSMSKATVRPTNLFTSSSRGPRGQTFTKGESGKGQKWTCLARRAPRWRVVQCGVGGPVGFVRVQCAIVREHVHRGALPPLRRDWWLGVKRRQQRLLFTPLFLSHGRSCPVPAPKPWLRGAKCRGRVPNMGRHRCAVLGDGRLREGGWQ